jgi:uncharacterized protein (DUF1330 family)
MLVLALIVGIVIGARGLPIMMAQADAPPAFVVAETQVTDPAGFTEYLRHEPESLALYHGRVAARGLPDVREGAPAEGLVTIYAFATPPDADHWYYSPEYAKLLQMRKQSAKSRVFFLYGVASR